MITRTKRMTKKEQRDASVEKLLSVAESLFIANGFHATTMEEIASGAGLTKGAVYFHFGDKQSVLLRLLEKVEATVMRPLIELVELGTRDPLQRVDAFLVHQAKLAQLTPSMLLLPIIVSIEFAGTGELPETRVKYGYRRTARALKKAIEDGQASGVFRTDVTAENQASIMLALNDGAMLEWLRRDLKDGGRELVKSLRKIILAGLVAKNAETNHDE